MSALSSSQPKDMPARERVTNVIQGGYAVSEDPNVVITTILGSCVAACMRDPMAGIGGMNHFLLPGNSETTGDSMKYGLNAMELLINGLLQRGALRSRLEVKLFGGAHVVQNLSDIGQKNAEFAVGFLRAEGLRCVGQSLGGDRARRIRFWPASGRVSQLLLDAAQSGIFSTERASPPPPAAPSAGAVELF
jgi:chemotaxis protein CheD